jgi:hypothetical protein
MSKRSHKSLDIWKKINVGITNWQSFEDAFCKSALVLPKYSEGLKDSLEELKKRIKMKIAPENTDEDSDEYCNHIKNNYKAFQLLFNLYSTSIIHSHGSLLSLQCLRLLCNPKSSRINSDMWNKVVLQFHCMTLNTFMALEMLGRVHYYFKVDPACFSYKYYLTSKNRQRIVTLPNLEESYWKGINMPEPFCGYNASQLRDVFRNKIVHRIFNYVVPINEKGKDTGEDDWHWYMFNPSIGDDEFTMLRKIAGGKPNGWNKPVIRCKFWKDANGREMDITEIGHALCATVIEQYKRLACQPSNP